MRFRALLFLALWLPSSGCQEAPRGPPIEITVPPGATFANVRDTLAARGLVTWEGGFTLLARARGDDREIRSGRYALEVGAPWSEILRTLTAGHVLTETLTIPEGFTIDRIAPRIAQITGVAAEAVLDSLRAVNAASRFQTPGPGLEGFLFPDTYRFAPGLPLERVVETLIARYRSFWTPERRQTLSSTGLSERELVTLASIIQAEARLTTEMPTISSVYHNRLERGMLLQADPTVLYALGGPRERLLFAAIDSVAESPYNTYTQAGLPPGPIGAPGTLALEAALQPAETDLLYFVARPTGEHIFSRSLSEHNRAVAQARRERTLERSPPPQGS